MPEKSEKRLTLKEIEESEDLTRQEKTAMEMIMVASQSLSLIAENILKIARHYYTNNINAQKKIEALIKELEDKDGMAEKTD